MSSTSNQAWLEGGPGRDDVDTIVIQCVMFVNTNYSIVIQYVVFAHLLVAGTEKVTLQVNTSSLPLHPLEEPPLKTLWCIEPGHPVKVVHLPWY